MDSIPPLSADLIDELDDIHPPIQAAEVWRLEKDNLIWRAARRDLVETLQNIQAQQKAEDLNVQS